MLYFKNRPFCFERNNATIDEIKSLAKLLPVIGNHIYDPNDPEAQLADSDFAFFKNTSNDSTNKILQFITKRISHEELKAIIDAHAPDLTISDDYISSKSFTITYKGKEIPCRWSGGPGGAANTNIQTELKEYAVQVAIELGPRNADDRYAIETIARALEDRLKGSKYIPSQKLMDSYIKSAILTANGLYSRIGLDGNKFDFELQCTGARSKLLYAKARKLGASNKDNWNPADLWGFAKDLSASAIENEIKDYESKISFYAFFGIDDEGNTTNRAFYDLEEAKQEAEFWVEDNEGKGHYAIFLSVTTEEEVRELLKGFSKQFLESHEEFQNPRDEYTLSHVSNADMVVEELVSTF